jgi:serine/threonine protein kinase
MKTFDGDGAEGMKTKCGTINYMSPELFKIKEGEIYEGEPVDIFATGTMLFMMLSGKQPFNAADDVWYKKICRNPDKAVADRKIDISSDAMDLISRMIAKDPKARLTTAEIKDHKWLKGKMASK